MAVWMDEIDEKIEQIVESSEEMMEEEAAVIIKDWINTCDSVTILASGKTGVTKSTLLNAL